MPYCTTCKTTTEDAQQHLLDHAAANGHDITRRPNGTYGCSCAPGPNDWWSTLEGAAEHAITETAARSSHTFIDTAPEATQEATP